MLLCCLLMCLNVFRICAMTRENRRVRDWNIPRLDNNDNITYNAVGANATARPQGSHDSIRWKWVDAKINFVDPGFCHAFWVETEEGDGGGTLHSCSNREGITTLLLHPLQQTRSNSKIAIIDNIFSGIPNLESNSARGRKKNRRRHFAEFTTTNTTICSHFDNNPVIIPLRYSRFSFSVYACR